MEANHHLNLIGFILVFLSASIGGLHVIVSVILLVAGTAAIFFPEKVEELIEECRNS
jgi:hypothetical protein